MKNVKETVMHGVFLIAACVSVLAVALICIFLFANGLPAIAKIGPIKFLTGIKWKPMNEIFGIFPMIHSIWIFWTGGDRSNHTAIDRNQWKRSTYSFCSSGNHDSANDHRSFRECDPGSSGELL